MSVGRSAIRCDSAELCLRLRALQRVAQLGDALLRSGCGLGLGGLLFVVDAGNGQSLKRLSSASAWFAAEVWPCLVSATCANSDQSE
jgi:hypothetical protein